MNLNCPICHSGKKNHLTKLSNNMKIMGDTFPNAQSTIVNCADCGCVYVDMDANQSHFSHYYNSGYSKTISYYDAFGKVVADEYFSHIYASIEDYLIKESQILDMGAGHGEFSQFLIDRGYKNVLAVEPSNVNYVNIQKNGITSLYDDSFSTNNNLIGKFDVIILSHVLEHILDFEKALKNIKLMLKEDGILYIEVPDSKKYCDVDFAPYFFFTYEHIIHLTLETLENLSRSYGLELLASKSYLKCGSYYVINAVFKNNGQYSDVMYTDETKHAIEMYVHYSKEKLAPAVTKLETSGEKLILWGIGASTAQLLNETFDKCQVIALIDSNTSRQGIEYKIAGKLFKIQSPNDLITEDATIVVLPVMYKNSIINQIQLLGYTNKIITLS